MRFFHSSLGLTALIAAFAVGVRSEEAIWNQSDKKKNTSSQNLGAVSSERGRTTTYSSRHRQERERLPDPRLEELSRTLALSHQQQADIHPAIIRAGLGYDPKTTHVLVEGGSPQFLGPPLSRADFEDALFAILDVEQQLDYAATATEKEAWWQSVVSRLEADLKNETSPSGQLPPAEPAATEAPSRGRDRQLQFPSDTD